MEVYPHWLDGTCRRNAIQIAGSRAWMVDDQAEYLLKLHAFFGNTVVISEVEIVDSPVLWRIFSDPAFSSFLVQFPDFVQARVFLREYSNASVEANPSAW